MASRPYLRENTRYCLVTFSYKYDPKTTRDTVQLLLQRYDEGERRNRYDVVTLPYDDYALVKGDRTGDSVTGVRECRLKRLVDLSNPYHLTREDAAECFTLMFYSSAKPSAKREVQAALKEKYGKVYEHDVSMSTKIAMDMRLNAGKWYTLEKSRGGGRGSGEWERAVPVEDGPVRLRPDSVVFDLETAKRPFMFPDPSVDEVMSVGAVWSDGSGTVFVNSKHYGPFPSEIEYRGENAHRGKVFSVRSHPDERSTLLAFVGEVKRRAVRCWIGYNSDVFDMPFLSTRCEAHGIPFEKEFGFSNRGLRYGFQSPDCVHLDLYRWTERDSMLPLGQRGLKDVTRVKLGFEPDEVDPEEMMPLALRDAPAMIMYNASDVVATSLLNEKFVETFVYALGSIVPMNPDDILRSGSGSLCEAAILAKARATGINIENKPPSEERGRDALLKRGLVCKDETFVGGSVESSRPGIYDCKFEEPFDGCLLESVRSIRDRVRDVLRHATESEGIDCDPGALDSTARRLRGELEDFLRDAEAKKRMSYGIYHYDVKAMYPSIILTYKLQPHAVRTEGPCCDDCVSMTWEWKARVYDMSPREYEERVSSRCKEDVTKSELVAKCREVMRSDKKKKPLSDHNRDVEVWVCQRETPFFVNVVQELKDVRDNCKAKLKREQRKPDGERDPEVVAWYDNLQLSYKTVLNSCYGWLKMKGNRWGEGATVTAALVCARGRDIIRRADEALDGFSLRLNRDTDGTFRRVPRGFPVELPLTKRNGDAVTLDFANCVLNHMLEEEFANARYVTRLFPEKVVERVNHLSFEVDGPYQMMYIPASSNESSAKKKYAVFDARYAPCKVTGMEVKRRGEWEMLCSFQRRFLDGICKVSGSQPEDYYDCLKKAVVDDFDSLMMTRGVGLDERSLLQLMQTTKTAKRPVSEYATSQAVTTAIRRWAEMNNNPQFGNSPGTSCTFVVVKYPKNAGVSKRTVPISVFEKPTAARVALLSSWTECALSENVRVHDLIDWEYYTSSWIAGRDRFYGIPRRLQCPESQDNYYQTTTAAAATTTKRKKASHPSTATTTAAKRKRLNPQTSTMMDFYKSWTSEKK